MSCSHNWQPLYQKPTDSAFLDIYETNKLGRLYQCECGAIGKEKKDKIRQLAQKYWAGHKTRSRLWSENLETFAISQGQES